MTEHGMMAAEVAPMKRRKPVWTRAMRERAAEHGRKGSREGKRVGGLLSWYGKTPEEQAATVERLRTHRQTGQTNESKVAKAAQRARALAAMEAAMSARKAAFLADKGMLRKVPIATSGMLPPGVYAVSPAAVGTPEEVLAREREAAAERQARWLAEMSGKPWDADAWRAAQRARS